MTGSMHPVANFPRMQNQKMTAKIDLGTASGRQSIIGDRLDIRNR